jgi:hypothetical protein
MSEQFSVWIENDDFSRVKTMYIMVADNGYLVPTEGSFLVQPDRAPFMEWEPSVLDLKELILAIYKHLIIDEVDQRGAVRTHLNTAFLEEIDASRSRRTR